MNNKRHGGLHGLLMMLCCILPILALMFFLPQLKNNFAGSNLSWLFLLACPLMHILMMWGMKDKGGSCHGDEGNAKQNKERNASVTE